MAQFCAWCGKPVEDGDIFCAYCGKRADGSDAPTPQQTPPPASVQPAWQQPAAAPQPPQGQWQAPPQPPQPQWQTPPQPAPSGGGGKKGALIGGIIAAVVVAAVVVGGFVWPGFFKKDKADGAVDKPGTEETAAPKPDKTPAKPDTPKPTEAPKETEAPKPIATPAPTPEPTPEPTEAPFVNPFADVSEGDWYYDAVMWAGKNGVVSGTQFSPAEPANRGQALTFLWRAAGEPASKLKVSPYTDVTEGDWYYTPVLWGFENGLISTAADGQFHADGELTRAQAITFLCRAQEGAPERSTRSFVDVRETDWYFDTANWALEAGIVSRDATCAFRPDDAVTRAQFVTFLHRAYDPAARLNDTGDPPLEGFAEYGIPVESAQGNRVQSFPSRTGSGEVVTIAVSVASYEIYEEGYGLERIDGWEYRDMDLYIEGGNGSFVFIWDTYDYYRTKACEEGDEWTDDEEYYLPVYHNGEFTDCVLWIDWDPNDYGNDAHLYVTALVPKGYDGLVFALFNDDLNTDIPYLADYYSPGDFALVRMDGQAD